MEIGCVHGFQRDRVASYSKWGRHHFYVVRQWDFQAMTFKTRALGQSTTTGTGTLTLTGSSITGYQDIGAAFTVGQTFDMMIVAVNGSGQPTGEWEECTGTLATSSTVTRTSVTASSNSGSAVNFGAGNKYVYCTPSSNKLDILDGIEPELFDLDASVASNKMTITVQPATINFRNATLTDGTPSQVSFGSALSLTIPSGVPLGSMDGKVARFIVLALYTGSAVELAVVNHAGGLNLDESGVISTTAISSAPGNSAFTASIAVTTGIATVSAVSSGVLAPGQYLVGPSLAYVAANLVMGCKFTSQLTGSTGSTGTYQTNQTLAVGSTNYWGLSPNDVIYSTTARTNVPYRVIGFVDSTQTTAGVYAASPSLVAPISSAALPYVLESRRHKYYNTSTERISNTLYFNTDGRTKIVMPTIGTGSTCEYRVNGFTVVQTNLGGGGNPCVTLPVPHGSAYLVTQSPFRWTEF
jgi:hypothetical protein